MKKENNLRNIICFTVILTSASFTYYLTSFYTKYFPGNIYTIITLSTIADCSAAIISGILATYLGNKKTIAIFFTVGATAGSIYLVTMSSGLATAYIINVCVMLAKFGSSGAFNISFVVVPEFFDPSYRSTVFGISNTVARVFSILSSMVAEMAEPWPMLLYLIFCVASIVAALALSKSSLN